MVTEKVESQLKILGQRIRDERVRRNDPQASFAARLGISVPTQRKLESGSPDVSAGVYFQAIALLWGEAAILAGTSAESKSLFDRFEAQSKPGYARQRARRKGP